MTQHRPRRTAVLAALLLGCACAAARAQVSLFTVVDLARSNSSAVRIAEADLQHAQAALSGTRDVYIPSFTAGSSIGYTYGFPVGQPTLFNAQAQSLVISFSQPDYIRSARAAVTTTTLRLQDAVEQVELDTALDYLQLQTITEQLQALEEQKQFADRLAGIEEQRVSAGIESQIAGTRAELTAAQADLRRLDLLGEAAVLRKRLGNLTGLPPVTVLPEAQTIPGEPLANELGSPRQVASVDAALSDAASRHYAARGDQRQNYRPQAAFGVNYSRYAAFNNYKDYYKNFQHNNFDVGLQLTLPVFDAGKQARARESAAEAVHADAQAVQARELAGEQVTQLEASLPTLRAQRRLADLQAQLAAQQLQAVLLQINSAPATAGAPPTTPADEMQARITERARYAEALDARFALLKGELSLLRSRRALGQWIARGAR